MVCRAHPPLNLTLAGPLGFAVADVPLGRLLLGQGAEVTPACLTMTAAAGSLPRRSSLTDSAGLGLEITEHLPPGWLEAHRGYRVGSGLTGADGPETRAHDLEGRRSGPAGVELEDSGWAEEVARTVLTGSPAQLFGALRDESGQIVALGRAGLTPGWVGLGSIWVDPAHRRRGLGRAISQALLADAAARGHRLAHLQVLAANGPARALYTALGFGPHHEYVNLILPSSLTLPSSGPLWSDPDGRTRPQLPTRSTRAPHEPHEPHEPETSP